jgi:predicted RNA binding protein YcfA (HicA-like mRNA interferase family)
VSHWPSRRAKRVLAALESIGWRIKRHAGTSHKVLKRAGFEDYPFAFHDSQEIGPKMMARIAKKTGLTRDDL